MCNSLATCILVTRRYVVGNSCRSSVIVGRPMGKPEKYSGLAHVTRFYCFSWAQFEISSEVWRHKFWSWHERMRTECVVLYWLSPYISHVYWHFILYCCLLRVVGCVFVCTHGMLDLAVLILVECPYIAAILWAFACELWWLMVCN